MIITETVNFIGQKLHDGFILFTFHIILITVYTTFGTTFIEIGDKIYVLELGAYYTDYHLFTTLCTDKQKLTKTKRLKTPVMIS